jgi:Helicase associated domain
MLCAPDAATVARMGRRDAWNRERLNTALAALRDYAEQHGTTYIPKGTLLPDGRDLHWWTQNYRARQESLPADEIRDLESIPGWTWRSRSPRHSFGEGPTRPVTLATQIAKWVRVHGKLPQRVGASADEGCLHGAMLTLRGPFSAGELPAETRTLLEAIPGWVDWAIPPKPDWTQRAASVADWIRTHERVPRPRCSNPDERQMGLWLARCRREGPRQAIDEAVEHAVWMRRFHRAQRLHELPAAQRPLYREWVREQTAHIHGLDPARAALLATLPPHTRTYTMWWRQAEAAQSKANTGNPGPRNRAWLRRQTEAAEQGDLDTAQLRMLQTLTAAIPLRRRQPAPGFTPLLVANQERTFASAPIQVERARRALAADGLRNVERLALQARINLPEGSLSEVAAILGLSKDQYSGLLRRALAKAGQCPGGRTGALGVRTNP